MISEQTCNTLAGWFAGEYFAVRYILFLLSIVFVYLLISQYIKSKYGDTRK